eukprot:748443-Hanusia_phi.AAC.1
MKWLSFLVLPTLCAWRVLGSCSSLHLTQGACPLDDDPLKQFEAAVEKEVAGQELAVRTITKAFTQNIRDYKKWTRSKFSFQSFHSILLGLPHSVEHVLREKEASKNRTFAQFFHFSGPTGVGKSLVARVLARSLFADKQSDFGSLCGIIEINMRSLSSLKPWQVSDATRNMTGRITRQVKNCPRSVVILDEIQSMSYPQLDSLLHQLDLHAPCIFLLISDLGARNLNASMTREEATSVIREAALVSTYGTSPLLHKIILQSMVPFLPLEEEEMRRVAEIEMHKLEATFLREYEMWRGRLSWKRPVVAYIARFCMSNEVYQGDGGRGVQTFVHHELAFMVEVRINELAEQSVVSYSNVDVQVQDGEIRVQIDPVYEKGDFDDG